MVWAIPRRWFIALGLSALGLVAPGGAYAASSCPITYGSADDAKPNKVYLFVRRDLTTRVYYQLGGRRIDLNENGVDDAADIAFGQARDSDVDGVIDEVDRRFRIR